MLMIASIASSARSAVVTVPEDSAGHDPLSYLYAAFTVLDNFLLYTRETLPD